MRCWAAASWESFSAISCCCCCCNFSSSPTRARISVSSISRAASASRAWSISCRSMVPSPPAARPDCVPAFRARRAPGGTISSRAPRGRGDAAARAGDGAVAGGVEVDGRAATACAGAGGGSGATTGRRASWKRCIWLRTSSPASPASTRDTSAGCGTRSTAPRLSWLMSPLMKASGLARSSATIACSSDTPRSRSRAISDSESPDLAGPYSVGNADADAGAGAGTATTGVDAGRGAGAMGCTAGCCGGATTAGAGAAGGATGARTIAFEGAATGAWIAGCSGASTARGAATSAEYSRTSRPCPHSTSTRNVSNGSLIGCSLVTRITGRPRPSSADVKRRLDTISSGPCRPMRAKVSADGTRASSCSSSAGSLDTIGISARNGSPIFDFISSCPSPRAAAAPLASSSTSVNAERAERCSDSFTVIPMAPLRTDSSGA